jgi:hypothetical protein
MVKMKYVSHLSNIAYGESAEQNSTRQTVSKDLSFFYIAPLDPALKDGACGEHAGQLQKYMHRSKNFRMIKGCTLLAMIFYD